MTTPIVPAMTSDERERAALAEIVYDWVDDSYDCCRKAAAAILAAGFRRGPRSSDDRLEGRPADSGWIACSERMPESGGKYLTYRPGYLADGGSYMEHSGCARLWWHGNMPKWHSDEYLGAAPITHWQMMPLPPAAARSEAERGR